MDSSQHIWLSRLKRFWNLAEPYLPWLSLVWGIASAFLMTRGYQHLIRLVLYFVVVLIGSQFIHKLVGKRILHRMGLLSAQMSIQYIFLFLLPFLFFSKAWITLSITSWLSAIVLWDPWWERFAQQSWFVVVQSVWGGLLAVLFLFGVLVPNGIAIYSYFVCFVLIILSILATLFYKQQLGPKRLWVLAICGIAAVLQFILPAPYRFPPLAVWARKPHFGFGVFEHHEKIAVTPTMQAEQIIDLLNQSEQLCCFSPIVAPPLFENTLVHEWRVDGEVIDRIELPAVRGSNDSTNAYRTFSCKQNFGDIRRTSNIECRVFVADVVFLSSVIMHLVGQK